MQAITLREDVMAKIGVPSGAHKVEILRSTLSTPATKQCEAFQTTWDAFKTRARERHSQVLGPDGADAAVRATLDPSWPHFIANPLNAVALLRTLEAVIDSEGMGFEMAAAVDLFAATKSRAAAAVAALRGYGSVQYSPDTTESRKRATIARQLEQNLSLIKLPGEYPRPKGWRVAYIPNIAGADDGDVATQLEMFYLHVGPK